MVKTPPFSFGCTGPEGGHAGFARFETRMERVTARFRNLKLDVWSELDA